MFRLTRLSTSNFTKKPQRLKWISLNNNKEETGKTFKILSYNVLAQKYIQMRKDPGSSFLSKQQEDFNLLDEIFRMKNIANQILQEEPDIVCLQEVSSSSSCFPSSSSSPFIISSLLSPRLDKFLFLPADQSGEQQQDEHQHTDGVAIAFSSDRFDLLDVDEVKINPHFQWTCPKEEAEYRSVRGSHNVALVAVLADKKNLATGEELEQEEKKQTEVERRRRLIVTSCHLDFRRPPRCDPRWTDLQAKQLKFLIEDRIERRHGFDRTCPMCENPASSKNGVGVAVVGDMNLLPHESRSNQEEVGKDEEQEEHGLLQFAQRFSVGNKLSLELVPFFNENNNNNDDDDEISKMMMMTKSSTVASTKTRSGTFWFDHMLVSNNSLKCVSHSLLPDKAATMTTEEFPDFRLNESQSSDHLPVAAEFEWI